MKRRPFLAGILAAVFAFCGLALSAHGSPPGSGFAAPAQASGSASFYWGAAMNGGNYGYGWIPSDMRGVDTFESHAGKKVSIIHFGQAWQNAFNPTLFDNVRNHGSIPFYTWMSSGIKNSDIYNGNYDSYIRQFATAAKTWGHPFFLRFDHEMDGWWYSWGEGQTSVGGPIVNGNQPGDYVKMYRHVHDIFTSVGATNVTWVWCTNHESTTSQYPPLSQIYPGDTYVDWTCMDPYNRYSGSWLTFNQTLTGAGTNWIRNTYQLIMNVAPSKPMIIGEFASFENTSDPQGKAKWIQDALLTQIPNNFPAIKAALWYNYDSSLAIESSAAAQSAFASSIASPMYAANDFANISQSPIQPLSGTLPTATATPASSATPTPGTSPPSTATPGPTSTPISSYIAQDRFSRTLSGTWGSADIGGAYTLSGTASDFSVNGAEGRMSVGVNQNRSAYLPGATALSFDATFRVKRDKGSVGGGQIAGMVARRIGAGNDYLLRIRFPTDNTVRLQAVREVNGAATLLGGEAVAANLTGAANTYIRVHLQVAGTNPTTIQVRAWPDGQPEPSTWAFTTADSTASLQAKGAVGLYAYLGWGASNAPVLVSFDDWTVTGQ